MRTRPISGEIGKIKVTAKHIPYLPNPEKKTRHRLLKVLGNYNPTQGIISKLTAGKNYLTSNKTKLKMAIHTQIRHFFSFSSLSVQNLDNCTGVDVKKHFKINS